MKGDVVVGKLLKCAREQPMGNDTKYSRSTRIPQYEPDLMSSVSVGDLYDTSKYAKLIERIEKSGVSEEEKRFLKLAATRHIVFNYAHIADYYAKASKEMQSLMEDSALVIIDVEDALHKGYLKLSDRMRQLIEEAVERKQGGDKDA